MNLSAEDEAFRNRSWTFLIGMIIGAIIACSVSFKVINTCGENNSELSQKLITRQLQLDLTIAALNENEYTLDKILKTLDYRLPRPITMEN